MFRDEPTLKACISVIKNLQVRCKKGKVTDKGKLFNTEIYEIIELGNMLKMAEIICTTALARQESRGGHFRTDFPKRDDVKFLHHSLLYSGNDDEFVLKSKPVVITHYQPKERTY